MTVALFMASFMMSHLGDSLKSAIMFHLFSPYWIQNYNKYEL